METHTILHYTVVLLAAAVIAVPIAKKFELGAVLGYLIAGAVIGPAGLKLLQNPEQIARISELGVVLMLFVIGLELSPQRLWVMRKSVFGAGTAQMLGTTALIAGVAALGFGLGLKSAIVMGLGLALSSTAFGLQLLAERKELTAPHGRLAFAVLLFQDLAAIPILALIPVLGGAGGAAMNLVDALRVVAVIALVVVAGRFLLRPVFRAVAGTRIPEVFTATALLVVIGTAWLMELAGISMALGAFLAGLLLADSEYRHELESQIDPFKGLLLGLFFVSVGMSVDLALLLREPWVVLALTAALLVAKGLVLLLVGRSIGGLDTPQSLALAAVLAGGGEFAFVVFKLAHKAQLLDGRQHDLLTLVITLSMALTPAVVVCVAKYLGTRERAPEREFDRIEGDPPRVIIAGFGRVGQIVARILRAQRIPFTALENSIEQVDVSRRFGSEIYFGDPTRPELLRAAQADKAEIFVLATDDPEANVRTARIVRRLYPHLKIFARARNRQHAFRLMDLNVDGVVRETFDGSLVLTQQVLEALGQSPGLVAERIARFRAHDEALLLAQHLVYDDEAALVQSAQEAFVELERIFAADIDATT
ncbi:monovalent cation:proton antiporter-2 (CPA2) family protein [Tahibacter amnicola]|uniref:Monovalent cation:proton antiporter-2 (CPA2) family protein n=1 Tax=Tahibacter amnicola TaxID=2976241 RepID=A0ABY6BJH1_9GAMM|nr:monovalent cation:proton antiporter-2 (CPA2) family protein [Tahibacter amnicola]UXI68530.1 monovalent cation:proton antiporter-2 (CPA2) family protein [Tahibacter amnicola]